MLAAPQPPLTGVGHPPIVLRPEREQDAVFLAGLFRTVAGRDLALMPIDEATKDQLIRMQFASQTAAYRSHFPAARFDIIELDGEPVGRVVIDASTEVSRIVDIALMPERRGKGLGTAIIVAVTQWLARRVQCQVLAGNHASLGMFRRAGFRQVGDVPPYLHLEWRPRVATA